MWIFHLIFYYENVRIYSRGNTNQKHREGISFKIQGIIEERVWGNTKNKYSELR